jgi:hypothetical protein
MAPGARSRFVSSACVGDNPKNRYLYRQVRRSPNMLAGSSLGMNQTVSLLIPVTARGW